ncbi:hypothetical protein FQN49_001230 [Arthroderma sp. PD_2]|nr:hypothetical protein FQN49_001230 [Arthroderma sp. PD_2]
MGPLLVYPPSASDILERSKAERSTGSQGKSDPQDTTGDSYQKTFILLVEKRCLRGTTRQSCSNTGGERLNKRKCPRSPLSISGSEIDREAKEWAEKMDSRVELGNKEF